MNRSIIGSIVAFLEVAFFSASAFAGAQGEAVALSLKKEVRVYRSSVYLSDLVNEKLDGRVDRFIVSSPPWGSKKFITKNFISTRLPRGTFSLSGPDRVLLERPLKDRSDEVLARLEKSIVQGLARRLEHVSTGSVRVEFVRLPEKMQLPPGDFELSVSIPRNIYSYCVVNFDVRGNGGYRRHLSAGCRFHINAVCAVTLKEIKKGEKITRGDIEWKKVDLSKCYEKPLIRGERLVGMRAKKLLPKGSVIVASAVERYPDILKGSAVSIEISHGSMHVSARGRSLEDGYLGEKVLVKNLVSNRIEKYVVVAPGIVSPSSRRNGK